MSFPFQFFEQSLGYLNSAIATTLRVYFAITIGVLLLIALLSVASIIGGPVAKFRYHIKFSLVFVSVVTAAVILIPIYLLRPRNLINSLYACWYVKQTTKVLDITVEVRNSKILEEDRGALVCMNHQSALDAFLIFMITPILKRATPITKKEYLYMVPYGPGSWLAGVVFVDRSSPKAAYKTLSDCAQKMNKDKIKLYMFPEGTRNRLRGLLPFKRGAFKTAIMGQVPIIPVVATPYYFVDHKKRTFDKGHIIVKALEPTPTKGMIDADHEALMEKTRNVMLAEYEKLAAEVDKMSQKKEWRDKKRPQIFADGKGL